jgi:hypothetical protein
MIVSVDLEEEIERLRGERERLDQERTGALEAGRQAGEELRNKSRELAGESRVTPPFFVFGYAVFLFACSY